MQATLVTNGQTPAALRPVLAVSSPRSTSLRDSLESLAGELESMVADDGVEQAVEIGRLIIDRLYDGDLSSWRRRGPKSVSLRELARQLDRPLSCSGLYRAIALYELSEGLGGIDRWVDAGMGSSHLRVVLGLPREEQRRLLDAAMERAWTVAELEREAQPIRERLPQRARRGGRPRLPRFVKSLNRLRKCVADRGEFFGDLDAVGEMSSEELAALREQLAEVRERCDELEQALATAS
ncbi:hypothetical protein G6O69_34345 [Pseudenhygromyxa sp. WMMC2535]|uniref:hypothetical protein n=1 Tax=Pseudenhygromyxa sp. WMMC2535 TaxID=2712867 RepID=UPI001551A686|nr:hypothetical protein [Pseudenhygromyxa sp. WMMC2535]NVB42953.1 hypothetical protein [Pseudenhygromyxa sp. WMMC2535]